MKVHISIDTYAPVDDILQLAHNIKPYCDAFEVGPLTLYQHGITIVELLSKEFQEVLLIADCRITSNGINISDLFFDNRAHGVTIMAGISPEAIRTVCAHAQSKGKKIMIDLHDSQAKGQAALDAKSMGAYALRLYMPYEKADAAEPIKFFDSWDIVKGNSNDLPIFITGKVTRESIEKINSIQPYGVVIGRAITESDDPTQEARFFYENLQE
jgi:3-keto-L-gulonate-6-phosphate decarboxylase